jgi:trk system potassium uptake protein TrkA
MRLGSGLSIQEMAVPNAWIGKTLMELALRQRFKVSIVAVHDNLRDDVTIPPDPTAPLKDSDTLLVVGKEEALSRVARLS